MNSTIVPEQEKAFAEQIELDRVAFAVLRDEIRREYAGRYVVLAEGKVLATAPSYDEAQAALQRRPAVPKCYFIFEAESEPIFDVVTDY